MNKMRITYANVLFAEIGKNLKGPYAKPDIEHIPKKAKEIGVLDKLGKTLLTLSCLYGEKHTNLVETLFKKVAGTKKNPSTKQIKKFLSGKKLKDKDRKKLKDFSLRRDTYRQMFLGYLKGILPEQKNGTRIIIALNYKVMAVR